MLRILFWAAVIVLAVWLVRRALRAPAEPGASPPPSQVSDLVRCARCGLHLPRAEARESGGALFCSEEHARAGRSG